MSDEYAYTAVPTTAIASALSDALIEMGQDGEHFVRAATVCTLLVVEKGYDKEDIERLIFALSEVHPNRTFVVVLDETAAEVQAEYSARCHSIGPKEHVCSEVIRLTVSPNRLAAVNSVIRANLLTGMATELFVYSAQPKLQEIENISHMADQIIFSSASFEDDLTRLTSLRRSGSPLIDLEWVKLGIWRDQVREVFEHPGWPERLSELSRIEIEWGASSEGTLPSGSLLLAGWLMSMLHLKLSSGSGDQFTLERPDGGKIALTIDTSIGNGLGKLGALKLLFGSLGKGTRESGVFLKRGVQLGSTHHGGGQSETAQLDTVVTLDDEYRFSKPFEDESREDLLKRYYFVGESILNYPVSLDNALLLSQGK